MKKFLPIILIFSLLSLTYSQTKVFEGSQTTGTLPTGQGGAPTGGTTGQVLTKNSAANFDYGWAPGGGASITLQTNGTNNSSQTLLNLQSSAATNGLTLTETNSSGGNVQLGLSGTLTVAGGGTGLGTLTAHDLYVGNGTSAPNAVATGNAGQVLISNGGSSDPTFQDPIVSGPDAPGVAPTKNPVQIGLFDGTNVQRVLGSSAGRLSIDINSGTVTANQGAPPWSVSQSGNWTTRVVGNAGGIFDAIGQNVAASANELLVGGEFNTTPTTITSGNMSPLQLDTNGNLLVNVKVGGGGGGDSASSATGSGVPANANYKGINVGTTLRGATGVNPSGSIYAQQIDQASIAGTTTDTNSGTKSAGTQRVVIATDQPSLTNALTVTANAGTNLNTSALALDTSVNGLLLGQASTTSGEKGVLIQGAVTTSAPSYTTAQTDPLSLDTSGNLRVSVANTGGNPVNIGQTYNNTQPAPADTTALPLQADQAGDTRITYGAPTKTLSVWNSGTSLNATQNIYTNSGVTGITVVLQQTTTITAGAVNFEVSFDGTNWVSAPSSSVLDPTDPSFVAIPIPYTLQASTNKAFLLVNSGWQALRIKLTTQITGTGTVTPVYTLLNEAPSKPVTISTGGVGNKVNLNQVGGTAVSNQTAGLLDVNVKNVGNGAVFHPYTGVQAVAIQGWNNNTGLDASITSSMPTAGLATVLQYNRTAPTQENLAGAVAFLQSDVSGDLKVVPGMGFDSSFATWNSSTTVNTTQPIFGQGTTANGPSGAPQSIVALQPSGGTFTAGAITFEVTFDGTNYLTIPADAVLDPTSTTLPQISLPYTLLSATNKAFLVINRGWQGLRIKLSTAITGTGTLTITAAHLPATSYVHNDVDYIGGVAINQSGGNQGIDLERVAGSAVATAAGGLQRVGITGGNTGAIIDNTWPGAGSVSGALQVLPLHVLNTQGNFASFATGSAWPMQGDQSGNLHVMTSMDMGAASTTWTTATTINTTTSVFTIGGAPSCLVNTLTNAGPFTAGAITFEVSYDAVNWATIPADAVMDSSSTSLTQVPLPYTLLASTTKSFLIINRGWQGLRVKLSTAITGTSPTIVINPVLASWTPYVHADIDAINGAPVNGKATYRAATIGNVVAAASTASFFAIEGSSTKTIKITKIRFSGDTLTALAVQSIVINKYSTAISAGTATALTKTPLDSNNAASTANLCSVYTAAPTDGTLVGALASNRHIQKATTVAEGAPFADYEAKFGDSLSTQPIVLRGTAQYVGANFSAAPATAVTLSVEVEWTEE